MSIIYKELSKSNRFFLSQVEKSKAKKLIMVHFTEEDTQKIVGQELGSGELYSEASVIWLRLSPWWSCMGVVKTLKHWHPGSEGATCISILGQEVKVDFPY